VTLTGPSVTTIFLFLLIKAQDMEESASGRRTYQRRENQIPQPSSCVSVLPVPVCIHTHTKNNIVVADIEHGNLLSNVLPLFCWSQ